MIIPRKKGSKSGLFSLAVEVEEKQDHRHHSQPIRLAKSQCHGFVNGYDDKKGRQGQKNDIRKFHDTILFINNEFALGVFNLVIG